jgi:hypothetical protein
MSVVIKEVNVSRSVDEQKKHYKDSDKSPCKKCSRYHQDCFEAMKTCGGDKKTGYSFIERCSDFKN